MSLIELGIAVQGELNCISREGLFRVGVSTSSMSLIELGIAV